ncbi:hypothetical protein GCM10009773_09150 [Williamsia serinedens]
MAARNWRAMIAGVDSCTNGANTRRRAAVVSVRMPEAAASVMGTPGVPAHVSQGDLPVLVSVSDPMVRCRR